MNQHPVQGEPYQYPYETLPQYAEGYLPAYWYPSAYQPLFWPALLAGIADVAAVVILGSQALSMAKKALKNEEEKL